MFMTFLTLFLGMHYAIYIDILPFNAVDLLPTLVCFSALNEINELRILCVNDTNSLFPLPK